MRLLLKLIPKRSHPYVNDYHYYLQSAIYSLIRQGGRPDVHEYHGYKFFCFSNIFPYGDFREGTERNLLVSSPDSDIMRSIERASRSKMKNGEVFVVGDLQFAIFDVSKPFRITIEGTETKIHSDTPIVIRIPRARYPDYGIKPNIDYDYVYWRETIPLEAFVKQLGDNMAKKAKKFLYGDRASSKVPKFSNVDKVTLPEITDYRFIRSIAKPITVRQGKQIVIGSMWDLNFLARGPDERRTLEISLDSGLGERNALGFGFANPIKLPYPNHGEDKTC